MQSSRTERRILLWVFAAAVLVRMLYLAEHASSPFFTVPVLDEKYYVTVAQALVEGRDVSAINPGFRPFLYPYFLAFFNSLSVPLGLLWALLAQHLLGTLTTLLVAHLAMRLTGVPWAGAVAGALYLLAGPPLFFEGELLITGLFTFLNLLPLWVLSWEGRIRHEWLLWLSAGVLIGLAAQARPNALVLLGVFPLVALLRNRQLPPQRFAVVLLPWCGALLALGLFAAVQQSLLGHFQLLPGAGGVNLYLGNKLGADGKIPRQDQRVTYGEEYRDSVQVFAQEIYQQEMGANAQVDPSAISGFWVRRTLGELRQDPGRWLGLLARKISYLLGNREIPNNKNYAFITQHESLVLRLLPVRWWLLVILAALGLPWLWKNGDRQLFLWLVLSLGFGAAAIVLFFVNSRYRVPLWPWMSILAAAGVVALLEIKPRANPKRFLKAFALPASLGVLSLLIGWRMEKENFARDFFFRSIAHYEKNQLESAFKDAQASLALDASDPAAHFQLGNIALRMGDGELAYASYRAAGQLAPDEPRVYNNLSILHERSGRYGEAYRGYLYALLLAEDYAPALVNAALLELRAGLWQRAEQKIHQAQALGEDSVALLCAQAFLAGANGDGQQARGYLDQAIARDSAAAARLLTEQRQPLSPELLDAGLPAPQ